FFFFQAEDGIRDFHVTGVQTCALPISADAPGHHVQWTIGAMPVLVADENMLRQLWGNLMGNAVKYSMKSEPARVTVEHARDEARSEERRVGKECKCRGEQ